MTTGPIGGPNPDDGFSPTSRIGQDLPSQKLGSQDAPSGPKGATMEDLHKMLVKLGREDLFKAFQMSIIMMSMAQVQHAAERAKKATKEAREQK